MSFHNGREDWNCCCGIVCIRIWGGGEAGAITMVIGSQTWPSIGLRGVTGGPMNSSIVGTVGENFCMVHQHIVERAMQVGAVGVW